MGFVKYKFIKYNKDYPKLFLLEKRKLKKFLLNTAIEHVGSTSVPGLGGKGIIDIAIKTPKNKLNQFINILKKLGYEFNPEHQKNSKRIFLQKKIRYNGEERRIHIHLTLNNNFWGTFIAVREYLKAHDKECEKYVKLKKEAIKFANGEGKKYRDYKDTYLEDLTKRAMKELNN